MSEDDIGVREGTALSRLNCVNCGQDSLHHRGKCVHCGQSQMPPPSVMPKKRDWMLNRRKASSR